MNNRRFFLFSSLIIILVATLPYLIGLALTPHNAMFFGNRVIAPADFSIYYSYINQGRLGHLFMSDAFTSEPYPATLIQPLWLVLGLAARALHISAPAIFAIARVLAIPVFLWTLWWATGWIWPDDSTKRRIGYIFPIVASGLGGLAILFQTGSITNNIWTYPDLWVSEAYTMLTLGSSPHFILVTAGIIFILVSVERSWSSATWRPTILAGIVALLTLSIHPFHVLTWFIVWLLLTIWRWIQSRKFPWSYVVRWMTVIFMASPVLLLYALQLLTDPLTINRAIQNINTTTPLWMTIIGLGLPLFAGGFGVLMWKPKDERWRFIVALVVSYFVAIYLPLAFQRRLSQGIMIPIAWLAVPAVVALFEYWRRKYELLAPVIIFFALLLVSSTWLLVDYVTVADYFRDLSLPARMYYVPQKYLALGKYLQTTKLDQPVMSTLLEGNVLGALSAHHFYIGYGVETINFSAKLDTINLFYQTMTIEQQRGLLQQNSLCYVIDSSRTRAYGQAFQPQLWPDLRAVWSGADIVLYRTPYCR